MIHYPDIRVAQHKLPRTQAVDLLSPPLNTTTSSDEPVLGLKFAQIKLMATLLTNERDTGHTSGSHLYWSMA